MIYTLTLNPALDHVVMLDSLDLGETNRMNKEYIKAGGKGINVSKILYNLGEKSLALGYVGGFSGLELEKQVKNQGLDTDFIHVKEGFTRINVKIKAEKETEINGPGLNISDDEKNQLLNKLKNINKDDYLFLSGSIPSALSDSFYAEIMANIKDKGVKIIVDASGNSLLKTLAYKPFLIKPNKRELEDLFKIKIESKKDLIKYAKELQKMGAVNVIVSLGGEGAFLLDKDDNQVFLEAVKADVIDTVGSGDSMVAAYIYAIKNKFTSLDAFKLSLAAGAATAFSKDLATKEEIYKIYNNL